MIWLRLRRLICVACLLLIVAGCGADDGGTGDPTVAPSVEPSATVGDVLVETRTPTTTPGAADVVLATTFGDDAAELFFVGETGFGARASIANGKYVIEVAHGEWQVISPDPMPQPSNGVIEADVALNGSGFAGLVARSSVDPDGRNWMYVCLLDESGWAGCVASRADDYQDLFWEQIDGYMPGAPQRMRLSVIEDRIELSVNEQAIGSASDTTIPSGSWGVFAESTTDSVATITFDNLSISIATSDDVPEGSPTEPIEREATRSRVVRIMW